jgi:hypothetical protein
MNDAEIVAVAKRALARRPRYIVLRRIQIAVASFVTVAAVAASLASGLEVGIALVVGGIVGTGFILAWNFVWVNTALFRITREEMQAD